MKTLAERHADRIIRKAEHALAEGDAFDASRAGIGEVHPRHADAAAINEATNAAIDRTVAVIGAAPARLEPSAFAAPYRPKARLSGI